MHGGGRAYKSIFRTFQGSIRIDITAKIVYFTSHLMTTLSRIISRLLLLMILLSPAVQVHADHDSGGSNLQSMLSVVLKADSDVHDETVPHEDTTATGADGCTDHPAEIQAMTTCHTGAQISVQAVAALTMRIASFQIGADGKAPSFFAMREGTSSHKPPLLFLRI